jgi:dTDP-4-dehydrorhamnose reductase
MKIAVTGTQGQVVRSLAERGAARGIEIVRIGRPDVDLTEPAALARAIEAAQADVVVNAAAYTAVDKAESEPEAAMAVNAAGAQAVAEAAARLGLPVVQISTDYVFDGRLDRPYCEKDSVNPINVYGRTKLAGEYAVAAANPRHVIVRTAWVYSPFGNNFVKTMLRLGETRDRLQIVADQSGAPTSALDIADGLMLIAEKLGGRPHDIALYGTFHMTGGGATNWADFAGAVFEEAAARGRQPVAIEPIATAQYPTPAARPANSRLDVAKISQTYGVALPDWRPSVRACVARLLSS